MPKLVLSRDGKFIKEITLKKGRWLIGRRPDCEICLDDSTVSGTHALLTVEPSKFLDGLLEVIVEDQRSTNGTLVNGKKIKRHLLKHDETVHIGDHELTLIDEETRAMERTVVLLPDK